MLKPCFIVLTKSGGLQKFLSLSYRTANKETAGYKPLRVLKLGMEPMCQNQVFAEYTCLSVGDLPLSQPKFPTGLIPTPKFAHMILEEA